MGDVSDANESFKESETVICLTETVKVRLPVDPRTSSRLSLL